MLMLHCIGWVGCMDGGNIFFTKFKFIHLLDGLYKHGGRPPLNLVIVLDISGSMNESFNSEGENYSKLESAKNSI